VHVAGIVVVGGQAGSSAPAPAEAPPLSLHAAAGVAVAVADADATSRLLLAGTRSHRGFRVGRGASGDDVAPVAVAVVAGFEVPGSFEGGNVHYGREGMFLVAAAVGFAGVVIVVVVDDVVVAVVSRSPATR